MKKVFLVAAMLLLAAPAFAQGMFADVPTDHWAYDAVDQLQKDGIVIGYPDGTFSGSRNITRYEFAVAIARMLGQDGTAIGGLSKSDVESMLSGYAKTSDIPGPANLANLATKADVDAIKRLVDEFRDEIAALGVDVDALKRDVAALSARVDAIEAELKRVRWTGDVTVFAIAGGSTTSTAIDQDNRQLRDDSYYGNKGAVLMRNIGAIMDFDLKVVGRVGENTTANATINYGNYLSYVEHIDDYVGGSRKTSSSDGLEDGFFPYYLYIDAGMGSAALTVGRFPLQFTPYTLKMIDVDSYSSILKTSDGNYPVDGAKLAFAIGGVDVTLFAAKNDQNEYLLNGLTGLPNSGIAQLAMADSEFDLGNAVGFLNQITQSAGARFTVPLMGGVFGATYYQAWDGTNWPAGVNGYDQARVYGGDMTLPIPWFGGMKLMGSYTESVTMGTDLAPSNWNIDDENAAWDAKLGFNFGAADIGLGYKDIGMNFSAAGAWDKIGRWTNPTDIRGPYAEFAFPFSENLKLSLNGEWLEAKDSIVANGTNVWMEDDKLIKAQGSLKWGFSKNMCLNACYEWVQFDPEAVGEDVTDKSDETYLTLGLGYQMNPNARLNVGYQFIKLDNPERARPYRQDYEGGLGVVQLGVSF